jgi:hypothetical protein
MLATAGKLSFATSLFTLSSAMLVGCDWLVLPMINPIAIQGDLVWFEYAPPTNDITSAPSSLWSVNMTTGELRQIQLPVWQSRLQVDGDFYVTNEVSDDEMSGHIVAVRMSTRARTTIMEWSYDDGAWSGPMPFVADGRVAVVAPDGLLIYDLEISEIIQTINVPESAMGLLGFDGDKVLMRIGCDSSDACDEPYSVVSLALIDVVTENRQDIPIPPGPSGYTLHVIDASLTEGQLAITFVADPPNDHQPYLTAVRVFDRTMMEWQTIESGSALIGPLGMIPYALGPTQAGVNEQYVLSYTEELAPLKAEAHIDLVNIESGESRTLVRRTGPVALLGGSPCGILGENKVAWGDPIDKSLTVYDIATGQRQTVSLAGVRVQEN